MERTILYQPVKEVSDPLLDKIEITYTDSFPPEERRDFSLVRDLIPTDIFHAYALLEEGRYVGFITAWQWDDFSYIEHFAIDASARNGGIGGKALKQFLAFLGKPVVLEVEMPTDEMCKRRIGFYERLGFTLDNHAYRQPPYRPGDSWLDMLLMSYGPLDLTQHYDTVKDRIHQNVYGVL